MGLVSYHKSEHLGIPEDAAFPGRALPTLKPQSVEHS